VEFERGAHDVSAGFRGVPIESYIRYELALHLTVYFRLRVHGYSHDQSDVMIVQIPLGIPDRLHPRIFEQ
jgi:hypothetical protein